VPGYGGKKMRSKALIGVGIILVILLGVFLIHPIKTSSENEQVIVKYDLIELSDMQMNVNKDNQVELTPQKGPVEKIVFKELNQSNPGRLGMADIDEKSSGLDDAVEVYSIDPTDLNFESAKVTAVAKGNILYKCKDWNFTEQKCYGSWIKLIDIVPGKEYSFVLTKDDPGFAEINATEAVHLDKNYGFISDIFGEIEHKDNNWSEPIYKDEYVRVTYQKNLSNGNIIDVYARNNNENSTWFEVYAADTTTPLLGKAEIINKTGEWVYITINNLSIPTDTFDFKILGESLEFDYIHDAIRVLLDNNLTANTTSVVEGNNLLVNGSHVIGNGGPPTNPWVVALNDTRNGKVVNSTCYTGSALQVTSITFTSCATCTANANGSASIGATTGQNQNFNINWELKTCSGSASYSPVNLITYLMSGDGGSTLDNTTGNITILPNRPTVSIAYPSNGETYNTQLLYIRPVITGNNISKCWYNLNNAGNITFNCSIEPNITANAGLNNLTVYANNTFNYVGNRSITFTVNTSISLVIQITSPANNTNSGVATPKIKLLATDNLYPSVNYSVYIYYSNDTLYAISNNGTLTSNVETEIVLGTHLDLIGNSTLYKIKVNATDAGNNTDETLNLYYNLTMPYIELLSPVNQYSDSDGNISFSFEVIDAYPSLNCSIYINNVLNKTNSSSFSRNITVFNVTGINESANNTWKIVCINAVNNNITDSRIFHVDKTPPVINWINATPNPINNSQKINITANVTDNYAVKMVTVTINGSVYYMYLSSTKDVYYDSINISGLSSGVYNYSINATDNADNLATSMTGNFTILDNTPPNVTLNNPSIDYINNSGGPINITFNCSATDNLNLKNVSLYITNSTNQSFAFNKTANISGTSNSSAWNLSLNNGNYTWNCIAYDNSGNYNWSANRTITISQPAIDYYPNVTFNFQDPSDIDSSNVLGRLLNISYNISDDIGIKESSVTLYHQTNNSASNSLIYTNGTSEGGYQSNYIVRTNASDVWYFKYSDSMVYPATYNINESVMVNTPHQTYQLQSSNNYVKIELLNVSNTKNYSFFELMAYNLSSTTNPLRIYYCNSSFGGSQDPKLSSNCINFYNLNAIGYYNHSHGIYSSHHLIPFAINSSSGKIGSVSITSRSYFMLRGTTSSTNNWNISYIPNISRINAIQITTNSGNAWSNFSGTVDAHLHQYEGTDRFCYYACANDTIDQQNCSTIRCDLIDLAGLPPIAPVVYNPTNQTYGGNISINYTAAESPNNYPISYYNISLLKDDFTFNQTIIGNNSNNLSYI